MMISELERPRFETRTSRRSEDFFMFTPQRDWVTSCGLFVSFEFYLGGRQPV